MTETSSECQFCDGVIYEFSSSESLLRWCSICGTIKVVYSDEGVPFRQQRPQLAVEDAWTKPKPIPMLLHCPECHVRHIDVGEFATKPHHTHWCQHCGFVWRPAVVNTVGVQFLPGFKNDTSEVPSPEDGVVTPRAGPKQGVR